MGTRGRRAISDYSSSMSRSSNCVYRKLRFEHIDRQEPSEALAMNARHQASRYSGRAARQFVAKALGLEIQAARFARADEVIE